LGFGAWDLGFFPCTVFQILTCFIAGAFVLEKKRSTG